MDNIKKIANEILKQATITKTWDEEGTIIGKPDMVARKFSWGTDNKDERKDIDKDRKDFIRKMQLEFKLTEKPSLKAKSFISGYYAEVFLYYFKEQDQKLLSKAKQMGFDAK